MNYESRPILNFPYDNPITKVAIGIGALWVGFIAIKHAKFSDQQPVKRRARQGFTTGKMDHDIDKRNRAFGLPVPSNPDIPFYSRHNYNRRRRSKNFW